MTSVKALESWWERSPARTIVLVREVAHFQSDGSCPGDLAFGNWLHIQLIGSNSALCGVEHTCETEGVTRDDLICGRCFDAHLAITIGVDSYELGELHAIVADALEDAERHEGRYDKYLASDHWQHMRQIAHEYYGSSCCLCNATEDLNVHHRTYDRVGRERLADLIVLCRKCHATYHGKAA